LYLTVRGAEPSINLRDVVESCSDEAIISQSWLIFRIAGISTFAYLFRSQVRPNYRV
jgi:hypothetical protein